MKKTVLLFLLALNALGAFAADYYWVGGGGSWSDLNHWRLGSSGGSIPSIVPSASDNVFFTSASGFTSGQTVSLDANGFCNDMTWEAGVPNAPTFSRSSTSYKLEVWNNLSLAPTVSYQQSFVFKGSNTSSLTTNGTVNGLYFAFEIDKPGGTLNVVDSFVCPSSNVNNNIFLTAGTFNVAGKVIRAYQFNSNNTNARTLNATGATLMFSYQYNYRGTNKILNAGNSYLSAFSVLLIDGGTYNEVTSNGLFDGDMNVFNATISKLSFTNINTGGFATVNNSNTIDTVIFKGRGRIYNNNTIGKLFCERNASVLGRNNVFGTILAQDILSLSSSHTDTNTVDSLLLAPNKATTLIGVININRYMRAQGGTCQAFTEITASDSARLFFAPAATALIDNVFLTNIKAYGAITPIAVSGVDGDNNTGFDITAPTSLAGNNIYWVGGAGDWNDNTHWSYASGGTGGACIPFIADTVIFDAASGLGSSRIVTTSGNSYCHSMRWLAGVGTTTFNEAGPTILSVYGSVVLTPAVTMNAMLEFVGTEATSTITTNGSTLGTLRFHIRRKGTGAVTLVDNWTNSSNGVLTIVSGNLNVSGRTISINRFSGASNMVRSVDISNASITLSNGWTYTGANKTLNATGSYINTVYALSIDGLSYPKIDATYAGAGNPQAFDVRLTTIGALTFTGTNATSGVNIDANNIIRRLEFKGAGAIEAGGNVIDTLLLAGSRNYALTGTNTINNYFLAQSPSCTGLLEIRGATAGTLQFNPSTVISMSNVYLQNMTATGISPVAFNGADAGGNSGWTITSPAGTPRYWIGGSGDWNDASHWSLTSGGTGGACIPTVYDDVYFNTNSGFTGASRTVTVNNGNAYAHNIDWTGATNNPIWNKATAWTIEVWGDAVVLNPTATFTVAPLTFKGNSNATMSGSVLGNFDFRIQKPGGSLTLANNYSNIQTDIILNDGTLNLSNRTLAIGSISNEGLANAMSINMSDANITLDSIWRYNGTVTAHTLTATGSTLTAKTVNALGMTYNNLNVTGVTGTSGVLSNTTVSRLSFINPNTASLAGISGTGNTFGTVDYKGGGGIYGNGNVMDTLIFFPGNTYILNANTNTTINRAWYGSGTPCRLTEIQSSSTTANATVTVTSGSVNFDYIRLRRITAAGAAQPFIARQHTINQLNNTNWTIATYDGAAPIFGLGPDTTLFAGQFPYTLNTNGFFGSPSSQYTWNDASTQDYLTVTTPGTYSVTVNFVDGCTISDTINIGLRSPLPISLTSFTGSVQDCQASLKWTVADAVSFHQFVVERSNDGVDYRELTTVAYTKGMGAYTYTDKTATPGKSFYRLRMVDDNGSYRYSNQVSLTADCASGPRNTVLPNPTKNKITVSGMTDGRNTITIIDALGRLVYRENADGQLSTTIDLGSFAEGVYMVHIAGEQGAPAAIRVVKN